MEAISWNDVSLIFLLAQALNSLLLLLLLLSFSISRDQGARDSRRPIREFGCEQDGGGRESGDVGGEEWRSGVVLIHKYCYYVCM